MAWSKAQSPFLGRTKAARPPFVDDRHGCLMRAYLSLHVVSRRDDGSREAAVARPGDYEVRLVETALGEAAPLRLELHDLMRRVTLESVECEDLDIAEDLAERMIVRACELQGRRAGAKASG